MSLSLNAVYSVTATAEPDVFIVACNLTDINGETYDCDYCSRPDDPFGLNPVVRAWLVENEGNYEVLPPDPPSIPEIIRYPQIVASAKLTVADGLVGGFAADSAIAGGFEIDIGKFWMFFGTPQPDTDYIVNVFDGGLYRCYVQPDDYATDSFVVTTTDLAGAPADPACISIIIMRAV